MAHNTLWDELRQIQREMDTLFGSVFNQDNDMQKLLPTQTRDTNYRHPVAELWETDKTVKAAVEIPGVDKKDIKVHATDDGISIKVEKKQETQEEDKKAGKQRSLRHYQGYYRYMSMPDYADLSKVDATYKNGVLELSVPKKAITKKQQVIEVK